MRLRPAQQPPAYYDRRGNEQHCDETAEMSKHDVDVPVVLRLVLDVLSAPRSAVSAGRIRINIQFPSRRGRAG
jgi:hypothetical protein